MGIQVLCNLNNDFLCYVLILLGTIFCRVFDMEKITKDSITDDLKILESGFSDETAAAGN